MTEVFVIVVWDECILYDVPELMILVNGNSMIASVKSWTVPHQIKKQYQTRLEKTQDIQISIIHNTSYMLVCALSCTLLGKGFFVFPLWWERKTKHLPNCVYHSSAFVQKFRQENIEIIWWMMASAYATLTENKQNLAVVSFFLFFREENSKNSNLPSRVIVMGMDTHWSTNKYNWDLD